MTTSHASLILGSAPAVAAVPPATGVVVLVVLIVALVAKVLIQGATRFPGRYVLSLLDVLIAPLFLVFVIVVLERFHDIR
jgi:hypothetical protein